LDTQPAASSASSTVIVDVTTAPLQRNSPFNLAPTLQKNSLIGKSMPRGFELEATYRDRYALTSGFYIRALPFIASNYNALAVRVACMSRSEFPNPWIALRLCASNPDCPDRQQRATQANSKRISPRCAFWDRAERRFKRLQQRPLLRYLSL